MIRLSRCRFWAQIVGFAILAAACQPASPPPTTLAVVTAPTATIAATPIPLPTAPRTPPALPAAFQSSRLNPLDTPHTYIPDVCTYLRDKWDSQKAAPGTVVMIIMLHSINQGKAEGPDAINVGDFGRMMQDLHRQKFEAINTKQLADFLESNAKIPARSVLLLQDGRHYAENFSSNFRFYWDQWHWPVVNAWDIRSNTTEALWADQVSMEEAGWVDHQVYGVTFSPTAAHLSDDFLRQQIQNPIAVFQQRFHKTPTAIIWPAGIGLRAAQIARESGYRLGFTFNPRGPVMFNWVPLADAADSFRPSYQPEGPVNDPLMTLPRYWPYQVHLVLDSVRLVGQESADYAQQNKATELAYYDAVCLSNYGSIP